MKISTVLGVLGFSSFLAGFFLAAATHTSDVGAYVSAGGALAYVLGFALFRRGR